jgi:hypothetical protein
VIGVLICSLAAVFGARYQRKIVFRQELAARRRYLYEYGLVTPFSEMMTFEQWWYWYGRG